ncbi:MAG: hypothetical protein Unbinned2902contig1001_38 [Prokaryotic dsDNA virus sp.]|nr:MAG: hypothetical protein Unbinned2902contig1001_38 [Prokaryotic dsDNA virus sp.]|tara:strand:- start:25785 stop:28010 length:2226 start_codon:yes stop_codon:yes gene_type:complete
MTDREILEIYNKLKNSGRFSEEKIKSIFLERSGVDLDQKRSEGLGLFGNTPERQAYQKEKETEDYYKSSAEEMERHGEAAWNVMRQIGQGLTFGGSDELEAYIRSEMPDSFGYGTYDEEIKKVRSEINNYVKENPASAALAETAGALLVPGMVVAKMGKYLPYVGKIKEGQWFQNIIKRMTLGGTAGTIDMGLYGYGTGTGGFDSPERIESASDSAKVGAGIGMVSGPFTGIIDAGAKALSNKMAKKGMETIDIDGNVIHEGYPAKVDRDSLQFMNDELARGYEGIQDLRDHLNRIIELDKDIADITTLPDLTKPGSNIRALSQKLNQTSPTGRVDAITALENKIEKFKPIAEKSIKKFLGGRIGDAPNWKKILKEKSEKLAKPFYKKADSVMVNSSDLWNEINTLMKRKDNVGKMMRKAYLDTRMEIPSLNEITGLKGNLPSKELIGEVPINHLHALKLLIKQQYDILPKPDRPKSKPFASIDAGKLKNIMGKITNVLKDSSPDYKKASDIYKSRSDFIEAFDAGVKASEKGSKHTGDMVRRELSELDKASKKAYRLGYASKMYQRVRGTNVESMNAEKINKLFETEEKDKLSALYKSQGLFKEFLEKMQIIGDMDFRAKRALLGSQTDQMREVGERLADPGPSFSSDISSSINKLRGNNLPVPGLDDTKIQNRASATGAALSQQGPNQVNELMRRMEDEKRRSSYENQARALYPMMFPSLLAPHEETRDMNPFGLLGPR